MFCVFTEVMAQDATRVGVDYIQMESITITDYIAR